MTWNTSPAGLEADGGSRLEFADAAHHAPAGLLRDRVHRDRDPRAKRGVRGQPVAHIGAHRRAALATVVGNAAGAYVQVVPVAVGAGAIVERSVAVFTVIKLVGAAYLVVLGVRAIRHRHDLAEVIDATVAPRSARRMSARASSSV